MVEKENLRYKFKRNVGKKIVVLAKKLLHQKLMHLVHFLPINQSFQRVQRS